MFHKVHTMETGDFFKRLKNLLNPLNFHCPYYNLNFCIQTETVTVGADATEYVFFLASYTYKQKPLHQIKPWQARFFGRKFRILCSFYFLIYIIFSVWKQFIHTYILQKLKAFRKPLDLCIKWYRASTGTVQLEEITFFCSRTLFIYRLFQMFSTP